jgi:hypothetical protein
MTVHLIVNLQNITKNRLRRAAPSVENPYPAACSKPSPQLCKKIS